MSSGQGESEYVNKIFEQNAGFEKFPSGIQAKW